MTEGTVSLEERFVQQLVSLAAHEDRAALAALRRGLGSAPGSQAEAARVVYRSLPASVPDWRERDCWLLAGLFALHPHHLERAEAEGYRPSLADALRQLGRKENVSAEGVERRLVALLNAEREDLDEHLRHAISQLRAADVPVDYVQLLRDLRWWEADERWVQRRWARAFWGQHEQPETHPTTEGEAA
jgi:CRISPR system Cascade subunit CasB